MRQLILSAVLIVVTTGLTIAAEVTLVRFDKENKEVTVMEGDDEKTYRITDKTKFFAVDSEANSKEFSYDDAVKGLGNPKAEGKLKFTIATKDDVIVEAKMPARKWKK
jgi:hypothetical protein